MAHTGIYSSPDSSLTPAAVKPRVPTWREVARKEASAATSWVLAAVRGPFRAAERLWGASRLGGGVTSGEVLGGGTVARMLLSEVMYGARPEGRGSEQSEAAREGERVNGTGIWRKGVMGKTVEGVNAAQNSFAREAYLHRFDGTAIDTIFAPGEFHIPE